MTRGRITPPPSEPPDVLGSALWRRRGPTWVEHCIFRRNLGQVFVYGKVVALIDGQPASIDYHVTCMGDWSSWDADVRFVRGSDSRQVDLVRGAHGEWWVSNVRTDGFADVLDIDLGFTPSTNTLPIRRLGLGIGESASVTAVWVRFPELTVEPLKQRYTRVDATHYLYESGDGAFTADIEVDGAGIVVRYADIWESVER